MIRWGSPAYLNSDETDHHRELELVARAVGIPDFLIVKPIKGGRLRLYEGIGSERPNAKLKRNEYLEFDTVDAAKAAAELLVPTETHYE